MAQQRRWWKEAVVYQIYPKSFFDSNGDGVGDLRGIIAKLDYLKSLSVDVLWLNPVYRSPDADNGYDISDYQAINPQYGTQGDFDQLLFEAHQRGLKVIMDLVVNHTSDEHPWFVESRKSLDNPYRDYYIWRSGKNGQEPNNWASHFTKSAWTLEPQTGQYYLHLFAKKQPDLNWESSALRQAIHRMIAWWLERGIDGFRLDAINFISKARGLPDNAGEGYVFSLEHFKNGPHFHQYLSELRQKVLARYEVMTVGECAALTLEDAIKISAPERGELDMAFVFEHTDLYHNQGQDPQKLKEILTRWQTQLGQGWAGMAFNNHDQPRVVSAFGNEAYRVVSAKLFATLLLTLRGTPFLYQGEEIGMTNAYYSSIEQYNDLQTVNLYKEKIADGADPEQVFAQLSQSSRDRGRSPFQWNAERNAGFTSGKPWLGLNRNYLEVNLERDMAQSDSIFRYYQALIKIRKQTPALVYGDFIPVEAPKELFVFKRSHQNQRYLVALNLASHPVNYPIEGTPMIGNYDPPNPSQMRPYEARLYQVSEAE